MKCRVLQHRPSVPPTSIRTSQCHAMQPWGPLCCDGAYWSLTQPLPWVFRGPLSLATQGSGLCQVHHPVLTEGARGQLRPRAGGKGGGDAHRCSVLSSAQSRHRAGGGRVPIARAVPSSSDACGPPRCLCVYPSSQTGPDPSQGTPGHSCVGLDGRYPLHTPLYYLGRSYPR